MSKFAYKSGMKCRDAATGGPFSSLVFPPQQAGPLSRKWFSSLVFLLLLVRLLITLGREYRKVWKRDAERGHDNLTSDSHFAVHTVLIHSPAIMDRQLRASRDKKMNKIRSFANAICSKRDVTRLSSYQMK